MDLLRQLRENIAVRADAVVFFEVPNGLFYSGPLGHLGHYPRARLVLHAVLVGAGISTTRVSRFAAPNSTFDDQYFWLEARVNGQVVANRSANAAPGRALQLL